MKAYRYDNLKHYDCEVDCQIDPLESRNQGKEIYLLPADSTFKIPLPEKDGFFVVFNGDNWEYKEKPKPSHNDMIMAQINELKKKLSETDYKAIKYAEGWYSDEEYAEEKALRESWREQIRELEAQIEPEQNGENSTADGD